jgi:hypothetical protein
MDSRQSRNRDRREPPPAPPAGLTAVRPSDWLPIWRMIRVQPAVDVKPWADGEPIRITAAVKTAGLWACTYAEYEDGTRIFPGVELLALVAGMHETTAGRAMAAVCRLGFLHQYVHGSRGGRRAIASEYRLTVPDDLFDRIPLLTADIDHLDDTEHPASDHLMPHQVMSDQVITDQLISDPGTPGLRSGNTRPQATPPIQDLVTHPDNSQMPLLTSAGVEGAQSRLRPVENRDDSEAERRRQRDGLTAWIRDHPETA